MAVENTGHRVLGFGDMVNDVHRWVYRTVDPEGIGKPRDLMAHPAGERYFAYDGHESWNNARPDARVPVLISTYHPLEQGDPKCVWGDEVIAVATDGSGKVWLFAHHRSTVHVPAGRGAGGGGSAPLGQLAPGSRDQENRGASAGEGRRAAAAAAGLDRDSLVGEGAYNFWDTPRGNVSQDGRFFMFTSNWEETLGKDRFGRFREDVFIVKLEREGAGARAPVPSK
jgi:hypothetical protein